MLLTAYSVSFLEAWNAKLVLRGLYIELTVRSEVFFYYVLSILEREISIYKMYLQY